MIPSLFLCIFLGVIGVGAAPPKSYRQYFTRTADHKMTSLFSEYIGNVTVDVCAKVCELKSECKSFGYDYLKKVCYVYKVNSRNKDVKLKEVTGHDLYERDFLKYFVRLSNHHVPVSEKLQISSSSLEECARRCLAETSFKCHGFNHFRTPSSCYLLDVSPVEGSLPALYNDLTDYYEKTISTPPMSSFLNFGSGILNLGGNSYSLILRGLPVEQCGQRCLDEYKFSCKSFDYIHDDDLSSCLLSTLSVVSVGLITDDAKICGNHFERTDHNLPLFHPTLYARLSSSIKTLTHVSPNRCAQMCVEEEGFICRSFDYQLDNNGTCLLSPDTASMTDGLVSPLTNVTVHHFEMKPIYECGDSFTGSTGNFTSPGWPNKFPPHEDCEWHVAVPRNRIITIRFSHLELGDFGECNDAKGNRMLLTEYMDDDDDDDAISNNRSTSGTKMHCLPSKTKKYITKSNRVSLRFVSDNKIEDFGFRAFYTADWRCNDVLKKSRGEFASPGYPFSTYLLDSRCSWRLYSPDPKFKIKLDFSYFYLQEHPFGHCTEESDHVKILDGGTVQSPLIGVYCGILAPFFVISTGREMLVQFKATPNVGSSMLKVVRGFHAFYSFVEIKSGGQIYPEDSPTVPTEDENEQVPHTGDSVWKDNMEEFGKFKNMMWSMVMMLLVIVVILVLALLLFARYHRKQLTKYRGQSHWPWKSGIVSMKFLKSLRRRRQHETDRKFNNLVAPASNAAPSSEPALSSDTQNTAEEYSTTPNHDYPSPKMKFNRSFGRYEKLNDKHVRLDDEPTFP